MRLLTTILLALLLTSQQLLAGDQPADPAPPAEEQPGETPPADDQSDPEHRLRPKTDVEEETYKHRVVREDPFLNAPPGPEGGALAFYRPVDWLQFAVPFDRSVYIVQDATGQLHGFLTIGADLLSQKDSELIHVKLDYDALQKHVEIWLDPKDLKPRSVTKLAPAQPSPLETAPLKPLKKQKKIKGKGKNVPVAPEPEPVAASVDPAADDIDGIVDPNAQRRTRIEYLFDRVTIERDAGIVSTQERMRQLPYSFDIEELPLLVRQLDFTKLDRHWPFEALITDPEHKTSLPLSIAAPKRVDIITAEPQTRATYEMQMRLGEKDVWTWWIERSAPFRLVKFSDGVYTYTLHQYDAAPGSY